MAQRFGFLPELASLLLAPIAYVVLKAAGVDPGDAQVYCVVPAGLVALGILWWRAQPPIPVPRRLQPSLARALLAAAGVTLLLLLIETVTAELVLDIAGLALNTVQYQGDRTQVRLLINQVFAIPMGLVLIFLVGRLACRILPVNHPLRWLAFCTAAWYLIRLLVFYPIAQQMAPAQDITLPPLPQAALRYLPITAMSYAFLALGYIVTRRHQSSHQRRRKSRSPSPRRATDDQH